MLFLFLPVSNPSLNHLLGSPRKIPSFDQARTSVMPRSIKDLGDRKVQQSLVEEVEMVRWALGVLGRW